MDIFSDITAIQNRIAEISGAPPAGAIVAPQSNASFNVALAQALLPELSSAPTDDTNAAAPVPPEQIDQLVQQNADIWQVDPALIKSVIANESSFNANATSPVGAQGLMQLMPETAASLGVKNPYDPAQNVAGGTRYLRGLLDRFKGDTRLAVAAYNAGPEAVEKYGDVPPYAETQNYVQNVLGSLDRYRAQP
ncbi:MAG: lytic transglycosylase domain-containing protein [Candidatus Lustribacter sp.]|jgi:soluble lytic murein transglycosylase-like protein